MRVVVSVEVDFQAETLQLEWLGLRLHLNLQVVHEVLKHELLASEVPIPVLASPPLLPLISLAVWVRGEAVSRPSASVQVVASFEHISLVDRLLDSDLPVALSARFSISLNQPKLILIPSERIVLLRCI